MNLLVNKEFHCDLNNWYAPLEELGKKYTSIIAGEIMDSSSSAGDWSGYIIQKTGQTEVVAIGFSQYNNYPNKGFKLLTCEHPFYRGKLDEKDLVENVRNCWNQFAYDWRDFENS